MERQYSREKDDAFHHEVTAEYHEYPGFFGNIRGQLEAWHGSRGDRSVLASIVPLPRHNPHMPKNPFLVLRGMSAMGWASFFVGWLCWMCDGYDYFSVPITVTDLAKYFGRSTKDITWAITVTTLCRLPGALFFGFLSDRYGRRWPLCLNMLLVFAFELGTGFVQTYEQFLAIRACFGVIMGGTWPMAVATALENIPIEARGFVSGIVQQGYTVGYLLAAVIGLTVSETSKYHWRTLYWFGAGFSVLAFIARALLPESRQYDLAKEEAEAEGLTSKEAAINFKNSLFTMVRINWIRCLWCICVMAAFCFLAHSSQDLYPTYLKVAKGLSPVQANKVVIIANCGAVAGGLIGGNMSQYVGRRFSIVCSIFYTAAFMALWLLPHSFAGLAAGGFFMQMGVQSAWGVVPVYLSECSPPAFRALFLGAFYQFGNMASAGSAQIEATVGQRVKIKGTDTPDYARIQGVFVGIVLAVTLVCVVLGPEADSSHFEAAKVAYMSGAGKAVGGEFIERDDKHHETTFVEEVTHERSRADIH